MMKRTRRNEPADLLAQEPQADGFSWSETQTGLRGRHDRGAQTVSALDGDDSPAVTATGTSERPTRSPRPEI